MADSPVLIYLHGFNSSPNALKAQLVEDFIVVNHINVDYLRPDIPDMPDQAQIFLQALIESLLPRRVGLIGSSLGGFYATWLAEQYDLPAVLVNPAVRPHELMHRYLGKNINPYSQAEYELTANHMQTLKSLYQPQLTKPQHFLVLLQTADETLDAHEAVRRYRQCSCMIEYGGDHRFQGFERYMYRIFDWFNVSVSRPTSESF